MVGKLDLNLKECVGARAENYKHRGSPHSAVKETIKNKSTWGFYLFFTLLSSLSYG